MQGEGDDAVSSSYPTIFCAHFGYPFFLYGDHPRCRTVEARLRKLETSEGREGPITEWKSEAAKLAPSSPEAAEGDEIGRGICSFHEQHVTSDFERSWRQSTHLWVKKDGLGDISPWQVYRAKEKALEKIRGSVIEHYRVLWDYCEELKRTNVGTTALVEGYAGEFRRLYICLGALRDGFIRGCRRLIGLDGCFLKTEHGGQLLSAVGVDANNGMYPVAYAVVEVENGDNWRWFLGLLKDDLHINSSQHWTFISDKQKGLVNAIESLFENSEHRTCVRHLYNNFSASHKGLALKNCLWDAARATTVLQWVHHMQRMLDIDQGAYEWLESKPASHWSKSHFREGNKCDMLLNNLCESFNSTIVNAREKPILTMLEEIRIYLMKRIVVRRESSDRWTAVVGPRIQKILDRNSRLARVEWAEYAGNERFQVRHNVGTVLNAVDLRARTCTCRAWQLSGLPCCHAISSIVSRGLNVMEFVDDIYKKEAYLATYTPSISPITGPDSWPNLGLKPLDPPLYTKRAGRPRKSRRKEPNEASSSQAKRFRKSSRNVNTSETTTTATSSPRKRAGLIMTCRKCGERGHNSRGCRRAPPPAPN
ncbi:uncharacterized protein LOC111409429 [Olea europaea var. sylvestris]|uniref:uncharacterized protein LOC111409429 n=1 Tax=Olea europaea var. sylvestris TaxID=158386 RepID=UPI000C1D55AB|nr:uncharacterized protein LOC111409429 [Olea europaea var. sylvestris]